MKFKTIFSLLSIWALGNAVQAQCNFDPTVSGDSLLCPGETTTFTTQAYDSYQWHRRVYPDGLPEAIAGATSQTLTVDEAGLLYFYWVEATDNGCTEASPEVLLDGYVFLLPFVSHTGNFEFDPDLQAFKICKGDTMFLHFNYEANVTWFKNGQSIPNETGTTLAITESGAYTVQGAPGICPNFIQPLGLILDVVAVNCTSPVRPGPVEGDITIYPNPATDWLTIENNSNQPIDNLELINAAGQVINSLELSDSIQPQIALQGLPSGIYYLRVTQAGQTLVRKIIKQ